MAIFVLDTNVLLHDPFCIYKFKEHLVIIPIIVVEEVDKFKRDQSEVGRNARTISRLLDQERLKGCLSKGVELKDGGHLRVVLDSDEISSPHALLSISKSNDNYILGVALHYAKGNPDQRCVLVTKDTNLRIKADAVGIEAEDYFNDKVKIDELYEGWMDLEVSGEQLDAFEQEGHMPLPLEGLYVNQFLRLHDKDRTREVLTRVSPDSPVLVPLATTSQNVWGIQPRNVEQRLAMDLLLDPRIKLVSLIGKAGTGKTLMALAAGLQMVIDEQKYKRLIVSRPVHPLGKDIGYLPGDIDDKIRPWMQPIFDNLEYILHCNTEDMGKGQITYQYFIDKGWMIVEPLTYMRGRSIPNQYLLVDEAQNLSPHEIKSIITRAGHGTKVVLTGDPHQIDNPFLDASTNGISIYGHITLQRGERSELAECASNLL